MSSLANPWIAAPTGRSSAKTCTVAIGASDTAQPDTSKVPNGSSTARSTDTTIGGVEAKSAGRLLDPRSDDGPGAFGGSAPPSKSPIDEEASFSTTVIPIDVGRFLGSSLNLR